MRLFVDQNLPASLCSILTAAGHDACHAQDVDMAEASDIAIFERCCHEDRALITADKKLTKYLASSQAHCPTVLILREFRTARPTELGAVLVANLAAIAKTVAEHGHAVCVLAPGKPIRAVTLPLIQ